MTSDATTPAAGQNVIKSIVIGDLTQVSDVGGNVIISGRRPPYRLHRNASSDVTLSQDAVRRQPSKLLLARNRVMPFAGRQNELEALAEWLAEKSHMLARLIHAPGGQGKTRLAMEFADRSSLDGWEVWWASQNSVRSAPTTIPFGAKGLVVIVDYADRWIATDIVELCSDLSQVAIQTSANVRLLLLARSGGFWWAALSDRLESNLYIQVDTKDLAPLDSAVDATAIYRQAQTAFAETMGIDLRDNYIESPGLLADSDSRVLSIHMAALAALDAKRREQSLPTTPESASLYLLRREFAYWTDLGKDLDAADRQSPITMRRAVFLAGLVGALGRPAARRAIARSELTAGGTSPDAIIDEHKRCYPPGDPADVFEPLRPERLVEDFVALTVPGHHVPDIESDDWCLTAASNLLQPSGEPADYALAASALTTLVETSLRWPHVADAVLWPLLEDHPELAFAAGGPVLATIADVSKSDDMLLKIASAAPPAPSFDLEPGLAALSSRTIQARLAAAQDAPARASLLLEHGRRLAKAGQRVEAHDAKAEATAIARILYEEAPDDHGVQFAVSLSSVAEEASELGRSVEALQAKLEALEVIRALASRGVTVPATVAAMVMLNLSVEHSRLGNAGEAAKWAAEGVNVQRAVVATSQAPEEVGTLAGGLLNLSIELTGIGDDVGSLAAAREAIEILEKLAESDRLRWLPELARASDRISTVHSNMGNLDESCSAGEAAVRLCRELVGFNRRLFQHALAGCLDNLAMVYQASGRYLDALNLSGEAVEIYRQLAASDRMAYGVDLAIALDTVGTLLRDVGLPRESIDVLREALGELSALGATGTGRSIDLYVTSSLLNMTFSLLASGSSAEAATVAAHSVVLYDQLVEKQPKYTYRLAQACLLHADALMASSRYLEALIPARRAVSIYGTLSEQQPGKFAKSHLEALNTYAILHANLDFFDQSKEAGEVAVRRWDNRRSG
ncbi:hypothetical protein Ais01nite_41860 [Asanoa ishikariensis]|uniref:Tetratricopeptide repeat-containing protein n=1 Tax=Asanoa ishikariensis TaxID=137265 RepID=A0A1H3MIK7_9ACTN|nr:tetratricopeptide repeat protein [Asanoa ishikariensis]GIF66151.1 hypothetical protein Ais01nite_41860 [Asanoa ishikariensis]SDY76406.1 Tetratricopeptide repeat-containing protein [Asanoa ishikariensis]